MGLLKGRSVLILGASGLLGRYLSKFFSVENQVIGTYNSNAINFENIKCIPLDQTDANQVGDLLDNNNFDIVINTTSLANTDECERNPDLAQELNVEALRNILHNLKPKVKLVHISTDHLSNGKAPFQREIDNISPINCYAQSKADAEKLAMGREGSLIIRTNFFGGKSPRKLSFSRWIIQELEQGREISLFTDSYYSPICISDLVVYLELLISQDCSGIYNVVSNGRISKYEFGLLVAKELKLNETLIKKSLMSEARLLARRPVDMSLSVEKLESTLGQKVVDTKTSIESLRKFEFSK